MFTDEIIAVIAQATKSEVAHPLGAMRHLPISEEEVALTIVNALDEAGHDVVARAARNSDSAVHEERRVRRGKSRIISPSLRINQGQSIEQR